MEKTFLQNESKRDRLQALKDNCERSEKMVYPKELDPETITALKDELTTEFIEISRLDEQKKEFMSEWKIKVKPRKQLTALLMGQVRSGIEEVEEEVYLIADQEEGFMGFYNGDGNLIKQRPLTQDERQFRIINDTKKAN
jgi:hypothetical protein